MSDRFQSTPLRNQCLKWRYGCTSIVMAGLVPAMTMNHESRSELMRLFLGRPLSADQLARTRRPDAATPGLTRTRIRASASRNFLATRYLRTKGTKPQFPNGIVSFASFVSTTNTARSLAGFVWPALAL